MRGKVKKNQNPRNPLHPGAFFLFENKKSLVQVTMELDLNPTEAEKIHQSYLRLKGLDKVVSYCQTVEKHISSFLDFVAACEEYTPESQKLVEVFNLQKVIRGLKDERVKISYWCQNEEQRLNKSKQEEESTKQSIEKLKQEEYNRWFGLYGNGTNYYTNQYNEQ